MTLQSILTISIATFFLAVKTVWSRNNCIPLSLLVIAGPFSLIGLALWIALGVVIWNTPGI